MALQLTKQVEEMNDKTVCANADLKADIERWHKHKRRDFRALFVEMADQQIQYYQQVSLKNGPADKADSLLDFCLLAFCIPATFKVISGWVLICDSANSW